MDIVYVLGSGSKWNNNEIRFSLRSIQKNLSSTGQVFIVGILPDFLQNVIHIPCEDIFPPDINADGNIITKVLSACKDPRLSNDFLFINDDHFVLQAMDISEIPAFHKGDMNSFPDSYWQLNFWRKRLKRTRDVLNKFQLPAFHYDCHTPIIMNKHRFPEIVNSFDYKSDIGFTMKSIYANFIYPNNSTRLINQKKTIFQSFTYAQLDERMKACLFAALNDLGLNSSFKKWITNRFPTISKYEKSLPQDKIIEFCTWLNSNRNWDEGVTIFRKYIKNSNLQQLFEHNETPLLRSKLEYKFYKQIADL